MAIFSYKCPRCGQFSLIDPNGACQSTLRAGGMCNFKLPFRYELGNAKYRSKVDKHTNPPPLDVVGSWSWVDSADSYGSYHKETLTSGTVNLDIQNNYLFLWHTPQGTNPIAHLLFSDGIGTSSLEVSGVISPLNSRLQNIHSFFGNSNPNWITIADGPNLVVEEPQPSHPNQYVVKKFGDVISTFDPFTQTFWKAS